MSKRHPPRVRGVYTATGTALLSARGERTAAEVAKAAGVDPSSLCAYETGRALPSDASLQRLAKALGADLEALRKIARADARQAVERGLRRGGQRQSARSFAQRLPPKPKADAARVELIRQAAARRKCPVCSAPACADPECRAALADAAVPRRFSL